MHFLILVFLVPFIAGLLVPQRWYWLLSVAVVYGVACRFLVRDAPDVDPGTATILGVAAFGVGVVAVTLAAAVRSAMSRANTRGAPGSVTTREPDQP